LEVLIDEGAEVLHDVIHRSLAPLGGGIDHAVELRVLHSPVTAESGVKDTNQRQKNDNTNGLHIGK
jgi:hypothetical protein